MGTVIAFPARKPAPAPSTADLLIAAAAFSPEIHDWIARQLAGGRKPSEILGLLPDRVLH